MSSAVHIKLVIFILVLVFVASLNWWRGLQRSLGFNRPMPSVDAFTMFWMIAGGVTFCAQGFFDFTLYDFMSETWAQGIYGLVGLSAVWQASRQG
jgi:uncharacterized membrane protein YuzA (DUF378 family)